MIQLNEDQLAFVDMVASGVSCCLTGSAGAGKSTTQRVAIDKIAPKEVWEALGSTQHPHMSKAYPVVIVAYTRRAAKNIRAMLPDYMKRAVMTVHKLLAYTRDMDSGAFYPAYNKYNPLPQHVKHIILEEAGNCSQELFKEVQAALSHQVQMIMLGDLNQIKPAFGAGILATALATFPSIALSKVYRQAGGSPVLALCDKILSGVPISASALRDYTRKDSPEGILRVIPWLAKYSRNEATTRAVVALTKLKKLGVWDYQDSIIVIPTNVGFGTIAINAEVATMRAKEFDATPVLTTRGYFVSVWSVGEIVVFDKRDAVITDIKQLRTTTTPFDPTVGDTVDYNGHINYAMYANMTDTQAMSHEADMVAARNLNIDTSREDGTLLTVSHEITVRYTDIDATDIADGEPETVVLTTSAQQAMLQYGYATTVFQALGSQWKNVVLMLHESHSHSFNRETLYTAISRASVNQTVLCPSGTFDIGIRRQQLKGDTFEEKLAYIQQKLTEEGSQVTLDSWKFTGTSRGVLHAAQSAEAKAARDYAVAAAKAELAEAGGDAVGDAVGGDDDVPF